MLTSTSDIRWTRFKLLNSRGVEDVMYSQSLKKKVEKGGLFDIKVILKSFFEKPNSNFFTIQGTSVGKNSKYWVAH